MKNTSKLILTLLLITSFAHAQQKESYQSLMMQYFQVCGIDAEYEGAFDGMVKMVQQGYQTQEVPTEVWQEIYDMKPSSVSKFKGILASEYRTVFEDKQDLRNLIAFYTSTTGIQYKKDRNGMTDGQRAEFEKFKTSNTGMKLFGRIEQINTLKQSTSVYWSKELICSVTSKLKAKGFQSSMHMPSCN